MSGYTLTITTHGAHAGAQTTIDVDTATGRPQITQLRVRPADSTGLSPDQLPLVDLPALILALTPPVPVPVTVAPVAEPAVVVTPTRPRRAAAAAKATRATGTRRNTRRAAAPAETGRAYRRMPDQDQVAAVYRESNSATAVARHFEVPRHTANGWLRRLRTLGVIGDNATS
jgi:hypothetical protein